MVKARTDAGRDGRPPGGGPAEGAPKSEAVIEARHLTAGYGDNVILRDLTVDVARRGVTCIIGGSGCGKSTFIKCVIGLLAPMEGTITVDGRNLFELSDDAQSRAMARIGMLFQMGAMLNSITVRENVSLPLEIHTSLPRDVIDEMVQLKLELVGLGHAAYKRPSELSGGMKKRAALARAMALDPDLLLCDEPSAGLDPLTAAGLDDLIVQLKETFDMTVVVVTHELPSIDIIADHVVMLASGGRLVFSGPLAEAKVSTVPEVFQFFARSMPPEDAATSTLFDTLRADPTREGGPAARRG